MQIESLNKRYSTVVCINVCLCTCLGLRRCRYLCFGIGVCLCIYEYLCLRTCVFIGTCVRICVNIYAYVCLYRYLCMCEWFVSAIASLANHKIYKFKEKHHWPSIALIDYHPYRLMTIRNYQKMCKSFFIGSVLLMHNNEVFFFSIGKLCERWANGNND